ncbi:MAG: hypothetical protein Q9168_004071 [Polycauliona sp. 1 TL-2023]
MYLLVPLSLLISLLLASPIHAVSVSLDYSRVGMYTHSRAGVQTCHNLRPGRCCQGRPIPPEAINPFLVPPRHEDYRIAQWTGLNALEIAAVWQASTDPTEDGGCSGTPLATTVGPGNWRVPETGQSSVIITGASYIRLPTGQPNEVDAPWLEAEGILGLVTGGGEWVSKSASHLVQQQVSNWRTLVYGMSKTKRRRSFLLGEKGLVLSQPPPKANAVWVDLITVDGVEFVQESEGSSVYRSSNGTEMKF